MMNKFWTLLIWLIAAGLLQAEESWRFLLLSDWHWAEKYAHSENSPDWLEEAVGVDVAAVTMLKTNYGGDLMLLPGDSNDGHWDEPGFIKKTFPGSTTEEAILKAGKLCYGGMIDAFKRGGYSKLIMAVGDHEMGDNPWPAGSAVARCQPQFREAFANAFNTNPDGGGFLYDQPVGTAASRPLGTKYENTSYATRHKNVLFVTVDAFHQEDPDKKIGDEGSVTGTVTGEHLRWLDSVLSEARNDVSIKHIFVQAHLPVIYPVRKVNSSGMMMDDGIDNPFWQTLRKYKVDIYFAGEVHANTVTKDPESNLIQLVSRGNFFNNFQTLDIADDRIDVTCYEQQPGTAPGDGKYNVSGKLVIDKSGATTCIDGEGELAPMDVNGRHFHFTFEDKKTLGSFPLMGMSGRKESQGAKTIRGVPCAEIFPNLGTFGKHYCALTAHVDLIDGPHGKAGLFSENSRMGVFAMGPLHGGRAVSYALQLKTESDGNQILINTGSIWSKRLEGFFNLHLNGGVPELVVSDSQKLAAEGTKLNDGEWHHIAVSMLHDACLLSDVEMFVDGKTVETRLSGADSKLHFNQAVRVGIGGLNYSNKGFDQLPAGAFVGALDDISIWTRPLTAEDVIAEIR
jgi:hypothetical protein